MPVCHRRHDLDRDTQFQTVDSNVKGCLHGGCGKGCGERARRCELPTYFLIKRRGPFLVSQEVPCHWGPKVAAW
jgi:hypothetical protein